MLESVTAFETVLFLHIWNGLKMEAKGSTGHERQSSYFLSIDLCIQQTRERLLCAKLCSRS